MLHCRLHLQNSSTTTTSAAQPDLPQPPPPPGTNVKQQQYRVTISRVTAPILTRGHFDRRFRCHSSALPYYQLPVRTACARRPSGVCAFQLTTTTHSVSEHRHRAVSEQRRSTVTHVLAPALSRV